MIYPLLKDIVQFVSIPSTILQLCCGMRDTRNAYVGSLPLNFLVWWRRRWHTRATGPVRVMMMLLRRSKIVFSLFGWGTVRVIRSGLIRAPTTPTVCFVLATLALRYTLDKRVIHVLPRVFCGGNRPRWSLICHC